MNRYAVLIVVFFCVSCQNATIGAREKGALGGAAVGAGLGAIVGHQTGRAGEGVAIGSALGALSGALIGNEMDRADRQLNERESQIEYQERLLEENRRLIEELRAKGADVRPTDRGVVVNLPDVLFDFDRATLTRDAKFTVREIAGVLRGVEQRRVAVEGHTDSIGTIVYNQRLSEERARSVANELVANGISRRRIVTQGFGETDPIASNKTEYGRGRNRRVEVIIENP